MIVAIFTIAAPLLSVMPRAAESIAQTKLKSRATEPQIAQANRASSGSLAGAKNIWQSASTDEAQSPGGRINPEITETLGLTRSAGRRDIASRIARAIKSHGKRGKGFRLQSGQPSTLNARSALSAALITSIGGRDNQFSEVTLLADWDGREDCAADREQKVDDFSDVEPEIDFTLTRAAISEHTIANGFNENIFYYGDSVGNFWVGADRDGDGDVDDLVQINTPSVLGAFGVSDDQVVVTGIAVNPARALSADEVFNCLESRVDFGEQPCWSVNISGCPIGPLSCGGTAYVCMDIIDCTTPSPVPAGVISPPGFPVTIRAPRPICFSNFSNIGGLAIDDDGSLYFQQVDLKQFTGANIVKIAEVGAIRDRSVAVTDIPVLTTLDPPGGVYGTFSGPAGQSSLYTNFSGTSSTFGNIAAITSGPNNSLYAAVARSFTASDDTATQATEGLFTNPSALGPTPSMIISFADCAGAFDSCTSPPGSTLPGVLPVADGFADAAAAGQTLLPGVNNFRVFALGNGPDIRADVGQTSAIRATTSNTLKIDMQIDYTIHSGIAVDENDTLYVVSGGTPAGVGKNPSPMLGEILCFEDKCPIDRRGDFVDLRGDVLPNPPASGGNVGDGDSDRFDHIFHQAPLDQVTLTPAGLAGLARGFLRYTNRLAPNPISPGISLGLVGGQTVQGDDDTSGPIIFEGLDPGHQAAGGDDQNPPFTGDDDNGFSNPNSANNPTLTGALSGGFEFLFGASGVPGSAATPCANNVWNAFFLNSNGNISFNAGDTDDTPTVPELRSGPARIAPAWADLNPNSRNQGNLNTVPVQALGFSGVNSFKVRWINVPERGFEACGSRNTFSVTLFDDGTGVDENSNKALDPTDPTGDNIDPAFDRQEGPTDFRFRLERNAPIVAGIGAPPLCGNPPNCAFFVTCGRRGGVCGLNFVPGEQPPFAGAVCQCIAIFGEPGIIGQTGPFLFSYCRMDLLGTPERPVIAGYSVGGTSPLNPPGLCETNLSEAAVAADNGRFGIIQGQTASIRPCLIGEGTEPHIFELFNSGRDASIGAGGEITFAVPDFDLRCAGNDPAICTPVRQRDLNRENVGFFGVTCPPNPLLCETPGSRIIPAAEIAVAPGQPEVGSEAAASQRDASGNPIATPTSGIINALCSVTLNIIGVGFFPNEATVVCSGFNAETGVPLQRPGKTVTTSASLACDTNGDGIPDSTIPFDQVTPITGNLVRARLPVLSQVRGTAFPQACCGGVATLAVTTTFTAGDNNIFGPFTRTASCPIDLGVRAPVVFSVTPSNGSCLQQDQDLLISGACFITSAGAVTSVTAVERGNPANVKQATSFVVLNPNLIDAHFNFGSSNAGRTFLIFVTGPGGTSRNLLSLPPGSPANCPIGNELGINVQFRCDSLPPIIIVDGFAPPLVNGCRLKRDPSGAFSLDVIGSLFEQGITVTVSGIIPRKVKLKDPEPFNPRLFTRLTLKGRVCAGLPGNIVVTKPPPNAVSSTPFFCNQRCPQN